MPGKLIPQTWLYDPSLDAPPKYRRACRYEAFLPDPLAQISVQLESSVAGLVSEAESRIHELNSKARPALTPMARLLLRTESIASSKVEGMQLSARELARAEARVETGGKAGPAALEILANIDAMELAIEEAASAETFTIDDINAIHARLMRGATPAGRIGAVREVQNWIGGNNYNPCGADFVPPPPEYVEGLLEDLCSSINDDLLPPIVQAALIHAQFETIHPYEDGNGRTGRALIHVVLRRRGLSPSYVPPISVILARSRDRYIRGLTDFQIGNVTRWIEYFATVASDAAKLASRYVDKVEQLVNDWREMLGMLPSPPRSDAVAWELIDQLPAHPTITGPVAVAKLGRSRGKTYEALQMLEDAGILKRLTKGKRNQAWEPAGLLDLIAEMEG